MKTITLKTDDNFFEKVTDLAKHFHLSKSELIRRAINEYESVIRKKELKDQLKKASFRVRQSNTTTINEFDNSINDGLKDV